MISNKQLKIYRSLKVKKYRHQEKKFLVEGENLVEAAISNDYTIELLLIDKREKEKDIYVKLQNIASEKGVPIDFISDKTIRSLCDTVTPQGIVAVVEIPDSSISAINQIDPQEILILDRIADPGNLGTIIRTAEWFGIKTIAASEACVDVFSSKVLRSSAGSFFYMPLILNDMNMAEILQYLDKKNFTFYVANQRATTHYFEANFTQPFVLIIGNERHGVQQEVYYFSVNEISIPGRGKTESLNAAMATGILLAETCRDKFQKIETTE